MSFPPNFSISVVFTLLILLTSSLRADTLILREGLNSYSGTSDNTIFEDRTENTNGAGFHLFAGTTAQNEYRRALIKFDLTGQLPTNATIESVSLRFVIDRAHAPNATHRLHRLTRAWGEGSVDAQEPGGLGAPANPGDATWTHAKLNQTTWTLAGGDYITTASASTSFGDAGATPAFSSTGLAADVQFWLANPAQNFGWIMRGNEGTPQTARRITSSEAQSADSPTLTITYTIPHNAARHWTSFQ